MMAGLTVLFDGQCALCRASAARVRRLDSRKSIDLLDLHEPSALQRFPQVDREEAMKWMVAVDPEGHTYKGADAWARIGLLLPGWNLLAWILLVPGIHWLARKIYAWIAANRYRWNRTVCNDDSCGVHVRSSSSRRA
jgi:predicted DCC family thiol-disulfide oxidoreductase YuxK